MPRITPVSGKDDVPAEHHAVVDDVLKVFGGVRGPFSVLLHSPDPQTLLNDSYRLMDNLEATLVAARNSVDRRDDG